MRNNTTNYRDLFLNDVPMMDARAPVEFAHPDRAGGVHAGNRIGTGGASSASGLRADDAPRAPDFTRS